MKQTKQMKPFLAFVKMQMNINYGISALKYRFTREKKKLWEPILIGGILVITFISLMALYIGLLLTIFAAGAIVGQPEMVLAISFVIAQIMIMFFGLFYIMGTFYFSSDIKTFIPMPLKPYEVIGGKFAVIMVNEYLTSLPILLPAIIIYGAGTAQGILYWLKSLILLIVVPAMPLAISAVIIMLLMRVVNFRRYKDLFAIVGGIIAIVIGMGSSMFFQRIPENAEDILGFFKSQTGLVDMIGSKFPPSIWATRGLADAGVVGMGYFLLYIGVCFALMLLLLWISNHVFYKAMLAGQEVNRKSNKITSSLLTKQLEKTSSPIIAIAKREWKLLMRTPLYVLNGFVGTIMGPILMVSVIVFQGSNQELAELINSVRDPEIIPFAALVCLGLMLLTACMNIVPSTSLSREGQTIWIAKMLPVSAKQQVTAKLLVSYFISVIGVLITSVIMIVLLKIPILWTIGVTVIGLVGIVPMVSMSMIIDVFHPKLVWSSEQEAMKQNMNSGIGMLLSMLVLAILGTLAAVMVIAGISSQLVLVAIGLVGAILGALSILALFAIAEKKYREIEA